MNGTLTCALTDWSPKLGDNHFMGWVTVAVYVAAGLAAVFAARALTGPDSDMRRERIFWRFAAVLMLFLAVNKQLDLQSFFTAFGRCHAKANGWYEVRGQVQLWFIIGAGLFCLTALAALLLLLRGLLVRLWPALLGLFFVSLFVLIRATSFHHVDELIGLWFGGIRMNWLLELPGPILVMLVALRRSQASRPLFRA